MKYPVILSNARGVIEFGRGGFVLHSLDLGAPTLQNSTASDRTVTFSGYILPEGDTEDARAAFLETARRRVFRIVSDSAGFTLCCDGRALRLKAPAAPEFSCEAPFNGTDAAFFTVRAQSAGDTAYFTGGERTASARGCVGKLAFPLAITEQTLFATLSGEGTLVVNNPGDAPCGFCAAVTAEGGTLTSVSLALEDAYISASHPLADGESLTIDTRAAQKDVLAGGASVLSETDWRSTFFPLAPGENRLRWRCEGDGRAVVRLVFTPLYL